MTRHYYFWIVARDDDGKPYLVFGSDESEAEAREKGLEMLSGMDFDIKRYPTRDIGAASAFFRGKRLEAGEGLSKARQRIGHSRSVQRLKRRVYKAKENWQGGI